MKFQIPEEMEEYLKPTEFCDCDSNEIKQKAEELTKNVTTQKEAAITIFNYVRDNFIYGPGPWDIKASTMLQHDKGICVSKTNLQIALLRAIGIPARYHQVIISKEILKGIVPDFIYDFLIERIWFHPWCECYLNGKWIACDLWLDKSTYDTAIKNGVISIDQIPIIDWDGETDLKTTTPWILEDVGIHSSYDEVTKESAKENAIRRVT